MLVLEMPLLGHLGVVREVVVMPFLVVVVVEVVLVVERLIVDLSVPILNVMMLLSTFCWVPLLLIDRLTKNTHQFGHHVFHVFSLVIQRRRPLERVRFHLTNWILKLAFEVRV